MLTRTNAGFEPRRIVQTHWNAGVFHPRYLPHILPELVVNALLFDSVVIRAVDLVTNPDITRHLAEPTNLEVFKSLLRSGAVRIRTPPPTREPSAQLPIASSLPLSFRAQQHSAHYTFKGRAYTPTTAEWALFSKLDGVLGVVANATEQESDSDPAALFPDELARTLERYDELGLGRRREFNITRRTAGLFTEFCRDSDRWRHFLNTKGGDIEVRPGPTGRFFRGALYQCARHFGAEEAGLISLGESVYAALDCEQAMAEGRYGGALVELPDRLLVDQEAENARDELRRVRVVPTKEAIRIPLNERTGEILSAVRTTSAYTNLQAFLRSMDGTAATDRDFFAAWSALAGEFAQTSVLEQTKPGSTVQTVFSAVAYLLEAQVLSLATQNQSWSSVALLGPPVKYLGPRLVHLVRAGIQLPGAHDVLSRSAEVRCSRIPIAKPSTTGRHHF